MLGVRTGSLSWKQELFGDCFGESPFNFYLERQQLGVLDFRISREVLNVPLSLLRLVTLLFRINVLAERMLLVDGAHGLLALLDILFLDKDGRAVVVLWRNSCLLNSRLGEINLLFPFSLLGLPMSSCGPLCNLLDALAKC